MRIVKVAAHAFGPFVGRELELAPGFNVIAGPNEAGKSSWHAAIYAGLCGMRRGRGARTIEDREFAHRHAPWDGDAWEVVAVVELDDGRRIELRHDLHGRVDCSARDLVLGTDVSSEILHDGAPDGARWLNLDRRTFLSVACVRQAEILAVVQRADELQTHLQRAAATAGADSTAAGALDAIDEFTREHVGLRRSNSTRPLQRAIVRAAEAEADLRAAREHHEDWLALEARLAELEAHAVESERERARVEAAAARDRATELRRRADEATEIAARHPGPPSDPVRDDELAEQVATAIHDWEHRPQPVEPTGTTAEELRSELEALPDMPTGDVEPHPTVIEAERTWLDVRARHDDHQRRRPPLLDPVDTRGATDTELDDLARTLEQPAPAVDPTEVAEVERLRAEQASASRSSSRLRPVALAIAATIAAGGIVLAVTGSIVLGIVAFAIAASAAVLAAGVVPSRGQALRDDSQLRAAETRLIVAEQQVEAVERQLLATRTRIDELGLPQDPAQLRQLAGAARERHAAMRETQRWRDDHERLSAELDEARQRLAAALRGRSAELDDEADDERFGEALGHYRTACRERREQRVRADRRPDLERALRARASEDARYEQDRARLDEIEHALRRAANAARPADAPPGQVIDVETAKPDGLIDALRLWQRERAERDAARRVEQQERARLDALLDGGSLPDLVQSAEHAEQIASRLIADAGGADELPDTLGPDPDATLRAARERAQRSQRDAAAVRRERDVRAERITSVAEATEALDAATAALDEVEQLEQVLQLTRDHLAAAEERVHRDIAPVLSDKVAPRLARVTDGRYRDVIVDPGDLEVKVRDPDDHWRSASQLSHGTSEQIYLLLRLAMAEILTSPGTSCPLLLDDVTVQSDPARTRAILEVLHEASSDHQVILFTQEDDVTAWADDHLGERDRLHRLPQPDMI